MNKDIMDNVMVKFWLDIKKMPLGQVKRKQIKDAFGILYEIQTKIRNNESYQFLVEASNRFYSIIPHEANSADTLTCIDDLTEKAEMLQSLNNIRFTYEFLYKNGENAHLILDECYKKLNAQIEVLDKNSKHFKIIEETVENSNMHYNRNGGTFKVDEIFKIQRNESRENEACKQFDNISNKKLLWHGTRLTNINHIISQGFQIKAPNDFAIGCTFGKGHYFSDIFANSAYWCFAKQSNYVAILCLCEVNLGSPIECVDPENFEDLPDGKHSVHGIGKYSLQSSELIDGAMFACGKIKKNDAIKHYSDYNEFVVYRNEQVKVKYLVKVNFSDSM